MLNGISIAIWCAANHRALGVVGTAAVEPAMISTTPGQERMLPLSGPGHLVLITGAQLRLWQHVIRSFLYMMQFAVGYFIMLLAMYFNGAFFESGCHHHSRCRLSVEPPYRVVSC